MYTDLQTYLLCDVLVKVDRMSMAHSLEVRSPLLDHRVVEVAAEIPVAMKRPTAGRGKMVLRELAAEMVPPSILGLPKHGFSAPVDSWYRGELGESLREEIEAGGEVLARLDRTRIDRLLSPAALKDHTTGERLFTIHTLLLWHRLFVRELGKSFSAFEGKGSRLAVDWGDHGA
jgi:asparagine synthase (glutamine-hydrolysing)